MEDIKAYIESGILELYVLGDLSREEKLKVEAMAAKHPEVKAELTEIEKSMEAYAKANAVEPDDDQRDIILNRMKTHPVNEKTTTHKHLEEGAVIPFKRPEQITIYRYAFAACFVLLIVSVAALINAYRKINDSRAQIAVLQLQNQHFANRVNLMDHELDILHDPTFKMLKLMGTAKSPASKLMVAWSPAKKKVMIDMANTNMPANDKDHQYQLWALVGGKPVDLGVFDADTTSKDMVEMKATASADAFAVTLEPRGGSASPTMSEMMVIGKF